VLTDTVDGEKIRFADDVAVAADGTIWFSDASTTYGYKDNLFNFLEGRATGRLLSYDPSTRETRVRMNGLFFANGVAMGPGDHYVLVTETGAGRIHRLWLQGENAGQRDLFAANLPGTPDNISFNGSDTFWVAMPSLRAALDTQAQWPSVRKLLSHLPQHVLAAGVAPYAFVVALGLDGEVKDNRQNSGEGYNMITSANECNGSLYLGSVTQSALARVPL
jgi:sugar lactone lactonase YvrE